MFVEIKWFIHLTTIKAINNKFSLNKSEKKYLLDIEKKFNIKDAIKIKKIEEVTNHDVKSIEYYLQKKFDEHKTLKHKKELIHFCATSEDINNISYALMHEETKKNTFKKTS